MVARIQFDCGHNQVVRIQGLRQLHDGQDIDHEAIRNDLLQFILDQLGRRGSIRTNDEDPLHSLSSRRHPEVAAEVQGQVADFTVTDRIAQFLADQGADFRADFEQMGILMPDILQHGIDVKNTVFIAVVRDLQM